MRFLLDVTRGDHGLLFQEAAEAFEQARVTTISGKDGDVTCEIAYAKQLPLNESNQDLLV